MLRMVVLFKGLRLTELGDVTSPNSGGMMIGSAGLVVSSADPFPNGLRHGKFIVFVHAGRVQTTRFRTSGTACSSHVLSDWQCVRPLLICRQGGVGRLTNISPIIVQLRISCSWLVSRKCSTPSAAASPLPTPWTHRFTIPQTPPEQSQYFDTKSIIKSVHYSTIYNIPRPSLAPRSRQRQVKAHFAFALPKIKTI
jgi:hypothetical protein